MNHAEPGQDPFQLTEGDPVDHEQHVYGHGAVCDTDRRGHATPQGRSPFEIVVDATEGFVPLWAKGSILRWRFRPGTLKVFQRPAAARSAIRQLLGEALLMWGDSAPVTFAERDDAWDFEIVVRPSDQCTASGCVLASAFFPDSGRHELTIYPKMFSQTRQEQVETLVHEIGHVFGLRHFFANVGETAWPSEIFGTHSKFSIMNYGSDSKLTSNDTADLKRLYKLAWEGSLTAVNTTPIRFMRPYHAVGITTDDRLTLSLPDAAFRR